MSNQELVLTAIGGGMTPERAGSWAPALKALGDPVRLRLLGEVAASPGGEACVCDISGPFDLSQPTISHHLKVLREAGLVTSERRATWVYYRVNSDALAQLAAVLSDLAAVVGEPTSCEVAE
ncbi:metalloregulator ArsR/SmtB family transcription factor [Gordonia sp. Z-3]|jgi:ArsR family transcriptional regulator|uniref:Metalloregulator ArsR/SmtB family transcription factor n=2 Tax=Gordonia TaxID=2053 RepID=A0A9X3DA80_9ACTN|nr:MULTISPECIES: metalloregulator ArsR/SmtB family transcription factor [Gordonia]MAU81981.1 transcriptional regulator [Gordonia sp. (in: high G+C Gram-positive bacteria)]MCF3941238.1 metalloregulator ArsR/SmtB family transcription factor [Gordonia tangerina]MCX2966457.1 metalloregulator ArsR/SmtB family transcription factor [Gordonia aquimaris]MED5801787.1 metalloregulator ArsR/SmtB family transcription factor [Gordonia sp. Z-3]